MLWGGRLPPFITRRLVERLDLAAVLQPLDDLPVTPVFVSNPGSRRGGRAATRPHIRPCCLWNSPYRGATKRPPVWTAASHGQYL
ncbi:hypothetical protein ATDW_08360 [Asticcacaulis sp. DW145]|nr:hypothetical protein ATDW_08360 [Asticcacaulis sp. DW145]